jgi:hypothetical protein
MTDAVLTDERVARVGALRRLLVKPELGSLIGTVIVFVFVRDRAVRAWHRIRSVAPNTLA